MPEKEEAEQKIRENNWIVQLCWWCLLRRLFVLANKKKEEEEERRFFVFELEIVLNGRVRSVGGVAGWMHCISLLQRQQKNQ